VEIRPAQLCWKRAFERDDLPRARDLGFIGTVSNRPFGPACVWINEAMKNPNLFEFHVQLWLT
jgi:hypothetical protein